MLDVLKALEGELFRSTSALYKAVENGRRAPGVPSEAMMAR
jgi:hypothetical protein